MTVKELKESIKEYPDYFGIYLVNKYGELVNISKIISNRNESTLIIVQQRYD